MSYVRWHRGESNVYVIKLADGTISCELCTVLPTAEAAFWHLVGHRLEGALVPGYALWRLQHEACPSCEHCEGPAVYEVEVTPPWFRISLRCAACVDGLARRRPLTPRCHG